MEWYQLEQPDLIDSPAFLIYKERVESNISSAIQMLGNDPLRLRPHVKTYKNREVTKMLMNYGVSKFKCATIAEAEMLAMVGAKNILLAYPLTDVKLKRFINLILKYPASNFSCLFDNISITQLISVAAVANNIVVNCFLDLNVGMNRTGIKPGGPALELFENASVLPGIVIKGFHVYDGHIRMNNIIERTDACDQAFAQVLEMQKAILTNNNSPIQIIVGGSATFPIHAKRQNVECSPGTFIYWDGGYLNILSEQPFQPAALVLTRVVSVIDENTICIDLGHKSIAAEYPLNDRFSFLGHPNLTPISQSEEHLVLESPDHNYKVGDVLYALPGHICPTCALYEQASVIENNKLIDHWKNVARDRMISI